jgi:hypothetical protein
MEEFTFFDPAGDLQITVGNLPHWHQPEAANLAYILGNPGKANLNDGQYLVRPFLGGGDR